MVRILFSLLFLALVQGQALADEPDPRELLEKSQSEGTPETLQSTMSMELKDAGGRTQSRELEIRQVGDDKQLTWFVSPVDLRGTAFLRLGDAANSRMWLYLPAFRRVERISGSQENESFLGSDFTYADMADHDLDLYSHRYVEKSDLDGVEVHKVESTLKEEDDTKYSKFVSYIEVSTGNLLREDLYDEFGDLTKRKTHESFRDVGDYRIPSVIVMTDLHRDHRTRLEMKEVKVDESIPDNIFTTQHMQRIRP